MLSVLRYIRLQSEGLPIVRFRRLELYDELQNIWLDPFEPNKNLENTHRGNMPSNTRRNL